MRVFKTKAELRSFMKNLRSQGGALGLVPTMGYLHQGHMSLVKRALSGNEFTAVSIFVNPTQFGPNEDLDTYPRDLDRDLQMLSEAGVDVVFTPEVKEIYGPDPKTSVEVAGLSDILIGKLRPGHFQGVTTVVSKLLNIFQPDHAYFGQKDYQQLAIIRKMVEDLDMPTEIVGVPIMRDEDGLALSSRNVRLTPEHREQAPILNRALNAADSLLRSETTVDELEVEIRRVLALAGDAEISSVDIRAADSLEPIDGQITVPVVVLLAVRFGAVFLIDNRVILPENLRSK